MFGTAREEEIEIERVNLNRRIRHKFTFTFQEDFSTTNHLDCPIQETKPILFLVLLVPV